MASEVDTLVDTVWEYHHMHHQLKKADCIFVLGSMDTRVAEYAADLFLQGWAPYLLLSGGFGFVTKHTFNEPEADIFARIAIEKGVPEDKILIENKSSNTGENIQFSRKLLEERGLNFNTFILVQKPYMERRTYATFKKQWPDKEFVVTSPPLTFEEYVAGKDPEYREKVISYMVGDLQRIKEYPAKGFQISQEIPDTVWKAYERLVELGHTMHLIKE